MLAASAGAARADAALDRLEKALPPGWSLLATGSELVIRHDRPCYEVANHKGAGTTTTLVTVELRYRLEPRWSDDQRAAAKATNQRLTEQLQALSARYRVETSPHRKAHKPATAEERQAFATYEAERAKLTAREIALPRCSLGEVSVFDTDETYAQLKLALDPPDVVPQAHHIVALFKQHCL